MEILKGKSSSFKILIIIQSLGGLCCHSYNLLTYCIYCLLFKQEHNNETKQSSTQTQTVT